MSAISFISKGFLVYRNIDSNRLGWDGDYRQKIVNFIAPTKQDERTESQKTFKEQIPNEPKFPEPMLKMLAVLTKDATQSWETANWIMRESAQRCYNCNLKEKCVTDVAAMVDDCPNRVDFNTLPSRPLLNEQS